MANFTTGTSAAIVKPSEMDDEAIKADLTSMAAGFKAFYNHDEEDDDDDPDADPDDIQHVTTGNNILPIWGDSRSMNINGLVLMNIVQHNYYKSLGEMTEHQQILDEIYYNVTHLEPWERGTRKTVGLTGMCGGVRGVGGGGVISTAFCLLHKLFAMRITRRQLVGMINHGTSSYIRALGFLFIRYCQPPKDYWAWFSPYLEDEDQVDPRSQGGDMQTIGEFVRALLTKLDWYSTLLPRIPVPAQKELERNFARYRAEQVAAEERYLKKGKRKFEESEYGGGRQQGGVFIGSSKHHKGMELADQLWQASEQAIGNKAGDSASPAPKSSRCDHHLRHHHCVKHRKKCPNKAKKEREAREKNGEQKEKTENVKQEETVVKTEK